MDDRNVFWANAFASDMQVETDNSASLSPYINTILPPIISIFGFMFSWRTILSLGVAVFRRQDYRRSKLGRWDVLLPSAIQN
jgi:hypothetical protein